MKRTLLLIILIPIFIFSQKTNDSLTITQQQKEIIKLNENFKELEKRYDYQIKINEQTLNSISNQIGATSYNLSIFAFLFGVLAIGLGVYVTWVERKIIRIREDNESLLKETKSIKEEVVEINELIQKDIYGLFLKIKREETVHLLNRLVKIPEDITNLAEQLLSRELYQEDFSLLKKAYLKLKSESKIQVGSTNFENDYSTKYLLIFFQQFLDESVKDEQIGPDLITEYEHAVNCSFENDIIKSTEDFMKAIIDLGFQSKDIEINSLFRAISNSNFKEFAKFYEIVFNSLKSRNDKFKFYEVISNEKQLRIIKVNYGLLLNTNYENSELTESEKGILNELKEIKNQLLKEENEKNIAEQKKREEQVKS
jgi:hypothetical protein